MNRITSTLLILALTLSVTAQDSWEPKTSGTTQNLNSICFINLNSGFVVGNNGTLLKTNNAGDTWSPVAISSNSNFQTIYFKDASTGFILTHDGTVLKSVDGGKSWSASAIHTSGLNGIDFMGNNGIIAADNGHFFTSSNGGNSWIDGGTIDVYSFNDVKFLNDTLAVAVGPNGKFYQSNNKGIDWSIIASGTTNALSSIEKANNSTLYISGENGTVIKYQPLLSEISKVAVGLSSEYLKGFNCAPKAACYAIGDGGTSLIHTGSAWLARNLDEKVNLNDVYFTDPVIGYVCGIGGVIYKTTQGGFPNSATELNRNDWKLYPNPADAIINLEFDQELKGTYNIVSLDGKTVLAENFKGNRKSILIEQLPAGAYYIVVKSDHVAFSKKFIKL